MALAQRNGRSRHRLILLALIAITLLTVDLRNFGPAGSAQRLVRDVLHPVTSLASTILSPVSDAWNSIFDYDELEAENRRLQAELDELRGTALEAEADRTAYQQLLEAVELPYAADVEKVTANVIRRAVGNFDSDVVTIDKGSRHGIEKGMAVVTRAGLVGRIERVDGATATVQLLSDSSLVVGVRLVDTDDVGLGHGIAGEPGFFVVDQGPNWPDADDPTLVPELDSVVVTDATSRYPADVPIGTVASVGAGPDGLTMEVRVELANDVEDLHFVSVLLSEQIEEIPLGPVEPPEVPEEEP